MGSLWEAALAAGWEDERHPGDWVKVVVRRLRDGHEEAWWALEVEEVGPYGPEKARIGGRGHDRRSGEVVRQSDVVPGE